jgi:hypothetical protein
MPMEDDDLLDMASAQKRTRTLQKVGIKKKNGFYPISDNYRICIGDQIFVNLNGNAKLRTVTCHNHLEYSGVTIRTWNPTSGRLGLCGQ